MCVDISVSSRFAHCSASLGIVLDPSLPLGIGRHTPTDIPVHETLRTDKESGTPEWKQPKRRRSVVKRARALTDDGDEGVGSLNRGLEPSSPDSPLLLPGAVGFPRASLGGGGAPAAQPPPAAGEVRVPPRQERRVRGLQVPGPHSGVRRAGDEQVQGAHGVAAGSEEGGLLRGARRGDRRHLHPDLRVLLGKRLLRTRDAPGSPIPGHEGRDQGEGASGCTSSCPCGDRLG